MNGYAGMTCVQLCNLAGQRINDSKNIKTKYTCCTNLWTSQTSENLFFSACFSVHTSYQKSSTAIRQFGFKQKSIDWIPVYTVRVFNNHPALYLIDWIILFPTDSQVSHAEECKWVWHTPIQKAQALVLIRSVSMQTRRDQCTFHFLRLSQLCI